MSDLSEVLPKFDTSSFRHLIHSLEKNNVTVTDLITIDPIDIARRCPLPLSDLRRLVITVVKACQDDLLQSRKRAIQSVAHPNDGASLTSNYAAVQTLDDRIDSCLGGGFRAGHVTEIVGESAMGKTQFAMSLLLSVQLARPKGLDKSAIYLSTEAPLNTGRLLQILESHPYYQSLPTLERPTLDRVHTIATNDLEVQEHIIRHQLPLAIQRFDAGLVVMDSVAANFRAEHETRTAEGLADRAAELVRLGSMLRNLARTFKIAVVVINQVSDRFEDPRQERYNISSSALSSPPSSTYHPSQTGIHVANTNPRMSLDHQQKFFTGWGNSTPTQTEQPKNPALGFTWANQLSARVVLKMGSGRRSRSGRSQAVVASVAKQSRKKRYIGIVFAPWAPPTLDLVQYEILSQGPISVDEQKQPTSSDEHTELLDPSLWYDGGGDEEFP